MLDNKVMRLNTLTFICNTLLKCNKMHQNTMQIWSWHDYAREWGFVVKTIVRKV